MRALAPDPMPFALRQDNVDALPEELASIADPVERHCAALDLLECRLTVDAELRVHAHCSSVCRALMDQRVPAISKRGRDYATVAMLRSTWPNYLVEARSALLRDYIQAGYVRLNDQADAFGAESYSTLFAPGRTCLEVAIRQGYRPQALILARAGDRVDLRPTPLVVVASSDTLRPPDMLALADLLWDDPSFTAQLRQAALERVVDIGQRQHPSPSSSGIPTRSLRHV